MAEANVRFGSPNAFPAGIPRRDLGFPTETPSTSLIRVPDLNSQCQRHLFVTRFVTALKDYRSGWRSVNRAARRAECLPSAPGRCPCQSSLGMAASESIQAGGGRRRTDLAEVLEMGIAAEEIVVGGIAVGEIAVGATGVVGFAAESDRSPSPLRA